MQFYKPHPWFVESFLKPFVAGRLVIEVGCGDGDFLKVMLEAGIDAYGIDLIWRGWTGPLIGRTIEGDATTSEMVLNAQDAVIIVARPCHNGWFAEMLKKADPSCEVLYIGKKGIPEDFGSQWPQPRIEISPVDEEDSEIGCWVRHGKTPHQRGQALIPWYLVEHPSQRGDIWWSQRAYRKMRSGRYEDIWLNGSGGFCGVTDDDHVMKVALVHDQGDLDLRETTEYKRFLEKCDDPTYPYGWIDRDGKFWRCAYFEHQALEWNIWRCYGEELDKRGFVKIIAGDFEGTNRTPIWTFQGRDRGLRLTSEQVMRLHELGYYDIPDEDCP